MTLHLDTANMFTACVYTFGLTIVFSPVLTLCNVLHLGMVANKFGHVVNISSIWGKVGPSNRSSYSSAKFAIAGLMDCVRNEVVHQLYTCIIVFTCSAKLAERVIYTIFCICSERLMSPDRVDNFKWTQFYHFTTMCIL